MKMVSTLRQGDQITDEHLVERRQHVEGVAKICLRVDVK